MAAVASSEALVSSGVIYTRVHRTYGRNFGSCVYSGPIRFGFSTFKMRFSLLFNGQNKYIFFSFSKYICSFFLIAFLLSILLVLSLAGQLCLPGHPLIGADAKNARNSGQPLVDSTSCRQSTKDPPRIQNNIIQQWILGAETGMQTINNVHFTA